MRHALWHNFRLAFCVGLIACFLAGAWPSLIALPRGAACSLPPKVAAVVAASTGMRGMACCRPGHCHCSSGKMCPMPSPQATEVKSACLCRRTPCGATKIALSMNREARTATSFTWTARPALCQLEPWSILTEHFIDPFSAPASPPPRPFS